MTDTPLTADEIERYARHIVLAEIGGAGQQKLRAARVAMVGAGGLGAPVLTYLAAAGVGRLTIIDDDRVSFSNLQRQVLFATEDVGAEKTERSTHRLRAINPHVDIATHNVWLAAANADALLADHDVIMDGSDNFETRHLVAETAEKLAIPVVSGAIQRFDGTLTVLAPHLTDSDGRPAPRYRDLHPEPPAEGAVPSCAEVGVLGALAGVMGSLMAVEAIKLITGAGQPLIGKVLLFDALGTRFQTLSYRRGR